MATKKSTSKKSTTKKAASAAKKEVVKYTAKDVALTKAQQSSLNVIHKNEDRIHKNAQDMIKLAFDSGQRLLKLKEDVQKKYGRVWKEWAQGNVEQMGVGYEQLTRYMKLAANPDQYALLDDTVSSIEGAVKQIEHLKNPAKAAARAEARAQRQASNTSVPAATRGIISNATLEEVSACTNVEELRGLIKICHARIDELQTDPEDVIEGESPEDVIEGESSEIEDQEDIETALS